MWLYNYLSWWCLILPEMNGTSTPGTVLLYLILKHPIQFNNWIRWLKTQAEDPLLQSAVGSPHIFTPKSTFCTCSGYGSFYSFRFSFLWHVMDVICMYSGVVFWFLLSIVHLQKCFSDVTYVLAGQGMVLARSGTMIHTNQGNALYCTL